MKKNFDICMSSVLVLHDNMKELEVEEQNLLVESILVIFKEMNIELPLVDDMQYSVPDMFANQE